MTLQAEVDGQSHKALSPDELRAKGYKIRVRHLRLVDGRWAVAPKEPISRIRYHGLPVFPRGGLTHAVVMAPDHLWAEATVKCSPADPFIKRVGYVLAVERAMKEITQLRRLASRANSS